MRTRIAASLVALGAAAAIGGGRMARAQTPLVPVVSDDEAEWQKERPPVYVGGGGSVITDVHYSADLFVEAGMRVATTPIWVHGLFGTGAETRISNQERFLEARAGLEVTCQHRGIVCGFFGVDVGGQIESRKDTGDDDHLSGMIAVPRVGLDLGGDSVRVRASLDGRWFRFSSRNEPAGETASGAGVSLGLALRF